MLISFQKIVKSIIELISADVHRKLWEKFKSFKITFLYENIHTDEFTIKTNVKNHSFKCVKKKVH